MRKQAKRPVKKKAPAKKKLIEGKYSHKFLTRLDPEHGKMIEDMKTTTGIKTYNGVVLHMLENYQDLRDSVDGYRREAEQANDKTYRYEVRIGMLRDAFLDLIEKPVKKGGRS